MRAHGGVAVQDGRHEGRAPGNQRGPGHRANPVGGMGGLVVLAEKHGCIHEQMEVVAPGRGVEVPVPGIGEIFVVRADRAFALRHGLRIVAAQHIDMRRHVLQVAGVGGKPAQHVGRLQGALRKRRHFQRMDIHVGNAGMSRAAAPDPVHPAFQHRHRLARARIRVGLPRLQVPEPAGRAGDRGLDIEGGDIGVVRMRPTRFAHRVGIVPVPGVQDLAVGLMPVPVPLRQRLNEGPLGRRRIAGKRPRGLRRIVADRQHLGDFGVRIPDPRPVVEGARRIGDPPPGHGAGRVRLRRPPEARDRLIVIEGEGPVQPAVEPALGRVRLRRNLARPRAQIEIVAHTRSPQGRPAAGITPAPHIRRPWRPGPIPGSARMSPA